MTPGPAPEKKFFYGAVAFNTRRMVLLCAGRRRPWYDRVLTLDNSGLQEVARRSHLSVNRACLFKSTAR
ncbi:MAG TPA: hypothetical protein VGZ73_31560 [Bryobacteraceae bacterium]|nr:hypothetical protein [Bryobacteraceae bacterium]